MPTTNQTSSFLNSNKYKLGEITWGADDCGDFWSAPFFDRQTEELQGTTGTYYSTGYSGMRPAKEDQEAELQSFAASM